MTLASKAKRRDPSGVRVNAVELSLFARKIHKRRIEIGGFCLQEALCATSPLDLKTTLLDAFLQLVPRSLPSEDPVVPAKAFVRQSKLTLPALFVFLLSLVASGKGRGVDGKASDFFRQARAKLPWTALRAGFPCCSPTCRTKTAFPPTPSSRSTSAAGRGTDSFRWVVHPRRDHRLGAAETTA